MKPGQVFSVYDYRTRQYRYFAAPLGDVPASGWFREAQSPSPMPEALAAPLPPNAQPIGEGPTPQGTIATAPQGMNLTWVFPTVVAVALLLWKLRRR